MSINPSISTIPFAAVQEVSYFKTEEILFSTHTVFRVGEIKQIDGNNLLYQVELQLTSDVDPQLCALTERIRAETSGSTGWQQLGRLLLEIGQFNKTEELYNALLEQTTDEGEKAHCYGCLGYVKDNQGEYEKAIWYYEKVLEIRQKTLPPNHPELSTSYNNIGGAYQNMGEYSKALSFYDKALEIEQKSLPPTSNYSLLATSSIKIGGVYQNMGEYSKALTYFERALNIYLRSLPANHPNIQKTRQSIEVIKKKM